MGAIFEKLQVTVLLCLFKYILDYTYISIISPLYAYGGATLNISITKTIFGYIVLMILIFLIRIKNMRPSDFFVIILLSFVIVPVLVIWGMQDESTLFVFIACSSFMLLQLLLKVKFPEVKVVDIKHGRTIITGILSLFIFALIMHILIGGGLSFFSFDITSYYDFRRTVEDRLLLGGWGYLWAWSGKSFLVIMMTVSLWRRQKLLFLAALLSELFLLATTAHKEFIFYPLLVLFLYFISSMKLNFAKYFIVSLLALVLIGAIATSVFNQPYYAGLMIYRTFDVVGINHFIYYNFFENNPHIYFSNSFLSMFFSYPYQENVALIIGADRYQQGVSSFSNAGYIASAIMEMGAYGVYIYTVVIAMVFKLADHLTINRMPIWVGTSIVSAGIFQLINADLTTSLLTGGIGLNILALWLIGRKDYSHVISEIK